MQSICSIYSNLNKKILKLTDKKYFNEIYAAILAVITVLGWKFQNTIGMLIVILAATIFLLLTKDLKYIIPNTLYFIFITGKGFTNNEFPIPIIIFGAGFGIVLLIFSFKDGFHLEKMHSLWGLLGVAIVNLVPIFWCTTIQPGNEVFYFLYFGNAGYLLLYIIVVNGIRKDGIKLLAVSFSYLSIIMAAECGFRVLELKDTVDNIFNLSYYIGWGVCNEAGIMICVSVPFIFYLMGKEEHLGGILFQNAKILIAIMGILLTTSRAAYLFGLFEIGVLYVLLLFIAKNSKLYSNLFLIGGLLVLTIIVCNKKFVIQFADEILELVFTNGFHSESRKVLWIEGYEVWTKNWLTEIFGSGIVSVIRETPQSVGTIVAPIVFHSTIIETLSASGIVGLLILSFHIYQKYRNLSNCDRLFFVTIGIGFIVVDMYGLLDNTYHMYYYMLPMAIIMATIDSSNAQNNTRLQLF